MAAISAKEQNLAKIFSSDEYAFEIPLYQRPYAWTTNEVHELLDDLNVAMERDNEAPYFLGSVVLIQGDGDVLSQVVDGQQRLTTLTMLFCVLRDIASDDETIGDLDKFVREAGNRFRGTEDRYRLSARERDKEFFQEHIQKKGSIDKFLQLDPAEFSDSQKLMFENVRHLHRELNKLNQEQRDNLAEYISRNCFLVAVSTSDTDSAYRIFSVLNDRGLDLFPTDILKANIIGEMAANVQGKYTLQWENIEEELGRDGFRDLFSHIRMIYRRDKLRGTLQSEFQTYVLGGKIKSESAVQFVDDVLAPYSRVYQTISDADYRSTEDAEKVNGHLRHLNRLNNFDWIPPAMAYFRRNERQTPQLAVFIRDLERLAYGLLVQRANINERINRFGQVLLAIEQDSNLFDAASPLQLSAGEKEEILRRLNGEIYTQARLPTPLLLRLDSLLAEAEATYDNKLISVEHVLPQNPANGSQWRAWFPDDDERRQWTHRLANLVLLSGRKNSRAQNYEFDRKKNEYFQRDRGTSFALTQKVIRESQWTPAVLERRQRELIDALKKEWRLD